MKRLGQLVFYMCFLIMLVACGAPKETDGEQQTGTEVQTAVQGKIGTEWKTKGFVLKNTMDPAGEALQSGLQEIAYSEVLPKEPEFQYQSREILTDSLRNVRYMLTAYDCVQQKRYILEKQTDWTAGTEVQELTLLQYVRNVASMDVVSEADIALLCGDDDRIFLVHLDQNGELISEQELTDGYAEREITGSDLAQNYWWCDERGYSYVPDMTNSSLCVFDSAGKFLMEESFGGKQDMAEVMSAFHTPDGSLIFAVSRQEEAETGLYWIDVENRTEKLLASLKGIRMRQFSMLETGEIYYSDAGNIWKWNVMTGERESVLSLLGSDIRNDMQEYIEHVMLSGSGALLVYVCNTDGDRLHVFSDEKREDSGITVMDFSMDSYLKKSAANFSRENADITIQYQSASFKDEESWTRVMAELAAGKGPDIISLFDREKLEVLYSKGILADMEEMLPADVINQMFAGSRSFGTIDGTLAGLCLYGKPLVMVTSDRLWETEYWNYKDIADIAESNTTLEGLFSYEGQLSSGRNLKYMVNNHLEDAGFLDMNQKRCSFDTEAFIKALELSKKYGELPGCPASESVEKVVDGSYLANIEYLFYSGRYAELLELYGEDCHFVSFPGQENYVGYWNSGRLLAVNTNTVYKEEISAFLKYLLDPENLKQIEDGVPALEDAIRSSVYWDEWSESWRYRGFGGGSFPFMKTDGESYLEEYVEFLDALGPWPENSLIAEIISEEAAEYFNGTKDAGQAAKLIQNRVQLYLDELN